MAIDDYFCHVCTIQRQQGEPVRADNGEIVTPYTDLVTAQPCRLVTKTQRLASPQGFVVVTVFQLFLPVTQDTQALAPQDLVSEVMMDDLQTKGPYLVDAVVPQIGKNSLHHVTLDLSETA